MDYKMLTHDLYYDLFSLMVIAYLVTSMRFLYLFLMNKVKIDICGRCKHTIDYNYPKSMVIEEIVLAVTKDGDLRIKIRINRKCNDHINYIEKFRDNTHICKLENIYDMYVLIIPRRYARGLTISRIRKYFRYDRKIYYQYVNVINNKFNYEFVSRSDYDIRI